MSYLINQHLQAIHLVISRMMANLSSTMLICAVIGVTLAIPSLMYVVLHNASGLIGDVKKETQMSVFLSKDIDETVLNQIEQALASHRHIADYVFVSKDQALAQLQQDTDNQDLLVSLDENPLPDAFFIEPASLQQVTIDNLKIDLMSLDGVHEVLVDGAWMSRLNSLLSLGMKAVWIFGGLLCFAVLAVVSNTIRMQVLTHKEEIAVSELFGATKGFIRRPFLYMGGAYGLGGGLFACAIIIIVLLIFNQSVSQIAQQYQSDFSLHFDVIPTCLAILLLATLLGWLAAYKAVGAQVNAH